MEDLLSEIVAARKEAEEIAKDSQMAEQAWNAERENFLSLFRRYDKRIEEMSMQNKRVLLQYRAEKIALESKFNESKARTKELLEKMEEDRYLWYSEKRNLEDIVAELQTKLDWMTSEKELLSQKNREVRTEAESFKAQLNEYNARLAHLEYESQQNERLLLQCRAENIDLQSRLNESKERTPDLLIKIEDERPLCVAEKSDLKGIAAKLRTKLDLMASESGFLPQKKKRLSIEAESLNSQLNALESMRGPQELLKKLEEDWHVWDVTCLEDTFAELLTNLDLRASERGSMNKNNIELSIEVEFLKTQVNECNATLFSMEDERQVLKEESASNEERLQVLLTKTATMENEINSLQHVKEEVKQQSDLIQQYKVTEHSLKQQIAMLQREVDSISGLLETQNQRVEESIVENGKLSKQVEELNKRIVELQETHVKLVQEKEEQKMKFESLHAEIAMKYRHAEEKHLELLKENEKQGNIIESLQAENAALQSEESLLLRSLKEATTRSAEISKKCLNSYQRMLGLENQSFGLHTELVATKLKCDEVTIQLNKIKEDKKNSNDSCQIQEEIESLHEKLMVELSRNKALEEDFRSTKSSLEEMKESACKGGQQNHNVWSELLDFAREKDDQIIDMQSHLLAMVEEKITLLADFQCQLSVLAAAKMFLEEENNYLRTELDRRTLVTEEEKVSLKGRLRELETAHESLKKDLEYLRDIAKEKEGKIVVLQYQFLELSKSKMCLEEKYNSLLTHLNKCTMASEENAHLQDRIRELENALNSFNNDPESKDIRPQKLKKHEALQAKSLVPKCGKLNCGKPNCVDESENAAIRKRTPKPVPEKPKKVWQP